MLVLYREKGILFAQCLLNLKRNIQYKNQIFKSGEKSEELIEVDAVYKILRVNGNIKIFDGTKYIKLNLGQFSHIVRNNNYLIEEVPELKHDDLENTKEVILNETIEENKYNNDYKKKRHKNNQNQGDDK